MFHGFGSGVPSSSVRWTHPGRQTCAPWGELVQAFSGKYVLEHQIVHLKLPTLHKPLVEAPEHLAVLCISESCLPSYFIDEVNIITPELVLCDHGDFWEDNNFSPIHQEERRLPHGLA
jgi:hypothetical protein